MEEDLREKVQAEALAVALENNYCTLDIVMRLGKTRIGLLAASKFKRVLVCYPTKSIRQSWMDDAERFNIDISHIEFTTYRSLFKYDLGEYDLLILDEIQLCSVASWQYISNYLPKRILGLSGTVPVTGDKKYYLTRYAPVKYVKRLEETVGVVNKEYEINIHCLQPSIKNDIPLGKKGKLWNEKAKIGFWERKYVAGRDFMSLLQLIQTIQNSETKLKKAIELSESLERVLIFVETIEQCKRFNCPAYHSKEKDSEAHLERFRSGEINKLVTVKQLASGITIPVNNIIILHCYSSNDKAAQRLARALNYVEGEIAHIDILALKNTREITWCENALQNFDKQRIKYI